MQEVVLMTDVSGDSASLRSPEIHIGGASTPDELLRAERDIRARLAGEPYDFEAAQAIQNIYRAASATRVRAERELLNREHLTWGGFTTLWVLWVWGTMDSSSLALECGVAKGTMTGIVTTLERRGLVARSRAKKDRRRVEVGLTDTGTDLIARLYPRFNMFEVELTKNLTAQERLTLASLLRRVIKHTE